MSNNLSASRSVKRFSRDGFQPIPNQHEGNMGSGDVEQGIPLELVSSNGGGLRHQSSVTPLRQNSTSQQQETTEKSGFFRGRRHKPDSSQTKSRGKGWDGEEDTVTTMGMVYTKILNFSIITRYFLYILPLGIIIAIPIVIGATSAPKAQIGQVSIKWFFTWIEIVWLSLWGSKLVAHFLPFVFQTFAGVVSSGVRKYSLVIRALEIPLSLVGWAVTSLATFIPLMTLNPDTRNEQQRKGAPKPTAPKEWEKVVQNILAAAVVSSLVFLAEKTFIQLISINYHRKQFSFRIKDSKRHVLLLGFLYDASRSLFPQFCPEFEEEDYTIADQLDLSNALGHKSSGRPTHSRSSSATPLRFLQDVGRVGNKITSAFGNVAHEITGHEVFNPDSAHSVVIEALEKRRSSEALARRIWMSFVVEGRDSLIQEDIMDVLGPERKEEAEEAFAILDRDGNGDVSLDEMILTVTEFSRERKSIASSMHDVDQAINVLDRMLIVVVLLAIVLIFVAFLNANFTTTLATTGTALLSLSFVFSVTAQEILGSCIFLFVKHPFDIGDRVDLGSNPSLSGNSFVVEHISLLFTVFRHIQGTNCGQLCQIPNIVLNSLWIENVSRSKAMTEQITLSIAFTTPFEDLQILKNELMTFVTDKDNSRDFLPTIDLDVTGTTDQSNLSMMVEIKHKSNWSNETVRRARRSKFMCSLVAAMKKVPIYPPGGGIDVAGSAANPTYSVAITGSEAKENAEETAQAREDARLVPTPKKEEIPKLSVISEQSAVPSKAPFLTLREDRAVDDLTSRDPAMDPARDETWISSHQESITLGESTSFERRDVGGATNLERKGTLGKRKSNATSRQSVRTTRESPQQPTAPYPPSASAYYQPPPPSTSAAFENQRPPYGAQPGSITDSPTVPRQQGEQNIEMRQVPSPATRQGNPYRESPVESVKSYGQFPPPPPPSVQQTQRGSGDDDGDEKDVFGDTRPYSGV